MAQVLKSVDRKLFVVLLAASLAGVLAVLPLTFAMIEGTALAQARAEQLPLPAVVGLALLQNGILLAVLIAIGLVLAPRVGLGIPWLTAWVRGERLPAARPMLTAGILGGVVVGVLLVALDALLFLRDFPAALLSLFDIPLWKRLLAGVVYGGITEEVLMRLFLLSLVAWLLGKFLRAADGRPSPAAFWSAIVLVALVFGLGHLPMTAAITPLTPLLVARALLLNGVAGVAFGYLFWRQGLEAAMLAHATAHLVLQGPGVALLRSLAQG